jgi:hypothetical protein
MDDIATKHFEIHGSIKLRILLAIAFIAQECTIINETP